MVGVGQVQPRTPPELIDDVIGQILVRIRPDESAYLAAASLVCKLWRCIISDPDFTRRYRELHRTPPLLGFLHNIADSGRLTFFPTAAACPFPRPTFDALDCRGVWALDCRHGRVLLKHLGTPNLLVRDPITGDQEEVPKPPNRFTSYSAMVLCAVAGCDHGDCHGGPFLIVLVGTRAGWAQGRVYSSETRVWGNPTASLRIGSGDLVNVKRAALVGDDACFIILRDDPAKILTYNFAKNRLSTIDLPDGYNWDVVVMPTDDGSLGLAAIRNSSNLCLWSKEMDPKGVPRWVQCWVMELEKLLPVNIFFKRARVIGFAEGVGVVFVRIDNTSTFMIELKSGRVGKVSYVAQYWDVFPFMSFYNPGSASSVLPLPTEGK